MLTLYCLPFQPGGVQAALPLFLEVPHSIVEDNDGCVVDGLCFWSVLTISGLRMTSRIIVGLRVWFNGILAVAHCLP